MSSAVRRRDSPLHTRFHCETPPFLAVLLIPHGTVRSVFSCFLGLERWQPVRTQRDDMQGRADRVASSLQCREEMTSL